ASRRASASGGHTVDLDATAHAVAVPEHLVDRRQRGGVAVPGTLYGVLRTEGAARGVVGIPAEDQVAGVGVRRQHHFLEEVALIPVGFATLAVFHADQHDAAVVGEVGADEHTDLVLLAVPDFVYAATDADLHAFVVVTEADVGHTRQCIGTVYG